MTVRSVALLNLKISADILCVISGDLASNRGRIIRLFSHWTFFTHLFAVFQLHFAADQKELTSHAARLQTNVHNPVEFGDPWLKSSR